MAPGKHHSRIRQTPEALVMPARLLKAKESIMEKRSAVLAVYAESLVFESNFGSAEELTTNEVTRRVQSILAGGAAAPSSEDARTSGTTKPPIRH
jgi:hypothetical protein